MRLTLYVLRKQAIETNKMGGQSRERGTNTSPPIQPSAQCALRDSHAQKGLGLPHQQASKRTHVWGGEMGQFKVNCPTGWCLTA